MDFNRLLEIPYTPIGNDCNQLLLEVIRILDGKRYVFGGGTALGLYRDGDLIPTDTDIDICVPVHQNIIDKIRRNFRHMPMALEGYLDDDLQQLVYLPNGIIVDIHFYYPSAGRYECSHGTGHLFMTSDSLEKPHMLETKYGTVPLPNDPEAFFVMKYGDDWRIPSSKKGRYHDAA